MSLENITKLKKLRSQNGLEFKYQLRNLLKRTRSDGLKEFVQTVLEFKKEILYDHLFFMDILNESILYFFLEHPTDEEKLELIIKLIHLCAPVGNKDSLEVLYSILKRLPRHNKHYPILMNYYGEIEHKISFLEQKISKLKLNPPQAIITEWYE